MPLAATVASAMPVVGRAYGSARTKNFFFADSNGGTVNITTLDFSENPVNVTYSGCSASARDAFYLATLQTELPTGAGGALYAANALYGVNVFRIDSTSGCVSEVDGSPFALHDKKAYIWSLVAWPPRPF